MKSYFTHYWKNSTCQEQEWSPDSVLNYTAGNMFRKRGVKQGDRVFVVTVSRGRLFLVGAMDVREILTRTQAARELKTSVWNAAEHLVAVRGSASSKRFDRVVPPEIVRELMFEGPDGPIPPKMIDDTRLDQQTLRGVRKLTTASGRLLEGCL